ncbi:MAG TPA: pitrilysin family protein [Blastocatellia bacterium]|nr:pitrilysin family protein [Blastocatellia bacterium]
MIRRMRVILVLAIIFILVPRSLGFLASSSAVAAHPRSAPTQSSFVLPIVKRDSLLNGLQLIVLEQKGTGSVSLHLRINSGALFDLANKAGLSDVTAGMLLRGGGGMSAKNVADTVESSGIHLSISADWDSTDLVMNGPAETLEVMFDLIQRLVVTPTFEQKELEQLKTSRIAALKKEESESVAVSDRALAAVYGTHPFGHRRRGSPESLVQISKTDVQFFHGRYYLANNAVLAVYGDTTSEQVTRLGRSKLGVWKKGDKVPPTFRFPDPRSARTISISDRPEAAVSYAAICQPSFSRRADSFFAATMMATLLQQTIAAQNAPERQASIEYCCPARLLTGPLIFEVKAETSALPAVLESVLQSMQRLQQNQVPAEQIDSLKSKMIAAMADQLKTPNGAINAILDIETYGLGRDYLVTFTDRVNAVVPADVQAAARDFLQPQAVAIAVAGPAAKLEPSLKTLGTVGVIKQTN